MLNRQVFVFRLIFVNFEAVSNCFGLATKSVDSILASLTDGDILWLQTSR
jgi:hypothetical protein